eukprot:g15149.t1
MKAHKKKDCKQRMVNCKLCKKRCTAEDLPDHERVECEHRQVTCRLCSSLLKQRELNYHQLYECENGEVICENDGFRPCIVRDAAEEVLQKEMRGHSCKRVHPQTQCTVCLESFESLGRKSIAPAMLMMDERRSCPHVQMCMRCAQSWTSRSAEKGHSPNCPECREEYNTATAYPDYLFHVASSDILRPPLPQREKMTSGTVWFVGQTPHELHWPEASEGPCNDANDTTSSSAASNVASVVAVPVSAESDRVVAAFADHHQMPLKEVRQLFAQLTEEQRWLTCMRFRHDPNKSGVPPIKLLQIFVNSCKTNGFRERHSLDRDPDGCFDQILKKADVQPALQRGRILPGASHPSSQCNLRWDETEEILHGLTPEEVDMILRRFSMDKQMGKRPEPLLRSYVESCRRKGFQKHHPTDALAEFAAEWKMPFHQVRQILETVSHPQQQQMVMKEYFCCSQDGTEKRMQTLQRYVTWQAFAQQWEISLSEVSENFQRLTDEQAEVVMKRFRFNGNSTQWTAAAQLRNYEQGAQAQICPQCGELVQKAMKAHKKKDCKQRMVPKAFENPADVDPDEISGERTRTSACSEPPPPDPEGRSAASSGGTVVGTVVELSEQSERVMAAFAEHHKMPLKEVRDLFAQLNEEQRWLTCMRFRYDPNKSGVPAIKLLQLFVHSCQTNGFRERHPLDRDPDGCFDQILKKADVQPTLQRGDPLLKKEAVQSTPQRGDPIPKKEGVQPALQRGDSIPKKEDVQSTPQRGDPTLKQEDVQSTPQHGDAIRKKEEVQPTLRQGGTLPGASHPSSQPNAAAEERERQLKDPMLDRHQTERPLHVLHGASNVAMPRFRGSTAAPLRRSATDPTSSREDGSMPGSPIDAPVHARPEAGYQAEVPEDDSRCDAQWPNYHVIAHGFQSQ